MSQEYEATLESYAEADEVELRHRAGLESSSSSSVFAGVSRAMAELVREIGEATNRLDAELQAGAASRQLTGGIRGSGSVCRSVSAEHNLAAQVRALDASPLIRSAAEAVDRNVLADSRRLLTQTGRSDSSLGETSRRLETSIRVGAERLAEAETSLLADKVSRAMSRMNYSPRVSLAGDRRRAIVRGIGPDRTAIFLRLDPMAGRLDADFAGFDGNRCEDAKQVLQQYLEEEGVRLRIVRGKFHGRKGGAALAAAAATVLGPADSSEKREQEIHRPLPQRQRIG